MQNREKPALTTYDPDTGMGYIYIHPERRGEPGVVKRTEAFDLMKAEHGQGTGKRIFVDYDADNQILGIEFEGFELLRH